MATTQRILDELHEIREQLLAESGGTLEGLVARLQKEQQVSGRTIRETRRTKRSSSLFFLLLQPDNQMRKDPYLKRTNEIVQ